MLMTSSSLEMMKKKIQTIHKHLSNMFEMELGVLNTLLGLDVYVSKDLFSCQKKYARDVLQNFGRTNHKPTSTIGA